MISLATKLFLGNDTYCNQTVFFHLPVDERCTYIESHTGCNSENGMLNFYHIYYCDLNNQGYYAFPLFVHLIRPLLQFWDFIY